MQHCCASWHDSQPVITMIAGFTSGRGGVHYTWLSLAGANTLFGLRSSRGFWVGSTGSGKVDPDMAETCLGLIRIYGRHMFRVGLDRADA